MGVAALTLSSRRCRFPNTVAWNHPRKTRCAPAAARASIGSKCLKLPTLYGYVESGAVIEIEDRGRRRTAVTQQALERALGKLLTDENFRERFFASPELAYWEAGFALSPVELEAL